MNDKEKEDLLFTGEEEAVEERKEQVAEEEAVAPDVMAAEPATEEMLEQAEAEIARLKDTLLRTVAEQENFKKRMERERLASLKYAGEEIFRKILPSVDNLERALQQGLIDGADSGQNLKALAEGVEMTLNNLLSALGKFEVKPINSVGHPFDPQHQEALVMEASETVPANHVIAEYEKGYFYKDRLLRPAKVIVSSGVKSE